VCACACVCVCVCVCMDVCVWNNIFLYAHTHIEIHIYTHIYEFTGALGHFSSQHKTIGKRFVRQSCVGKVLRTSNHDGIAHKCGADSCASAAQPVQIGCIPHGV